MSDKKRPIFTKEKSDILMRTLGQFDERITVDPLASEETIDVASVTDRSFLVHVLIETLCYMLEKDDEKRKILFNCLYESFKVNKLNDFLVHTEPLIRVRRHAATLFYRHIKQVQQSISPLPQQMYELEETSIPISKIEKYNEAFDEKGVIAKGGFGTVCLARHKIDGTYYAVKKIIFEYRRDSDYVKVMREVRNLSSLSNKYVVAYNNAWVQPVDQQDLNSLELDSEDDSSDYRHTDGFSTFDQSEDNSTFSVKHSFKANRVSSGSESSFILFQDDSKDSQYSLNINQSKSYSSSHSSDTKESRSELATFPHLSLRIKMMLCIQMEFCDYDLHQWLEARNQEEPLPFYKNVPDIFKEILYGVEYIHEKGIIHRDLKPKNIFYSKEKGVMKVGDFGLATLSCTPSDEEQGSVNHSTDLGTPPYAAPEQRSNSVYDSKVDMYSLGIILIELLVKTKTKMEFDDVMKNLKFGTMPEEVKEKWPEYVPLLKNLLQENHTRRLTAKEVLAMPLFKDKNTEEIDLEQKVKDLERELANKEQEFQNRERALTQQLQKQMEQRLEEQKWSMEQKFQEQKRAIEEALVSKERIFQQISEEVKLLKEYMKNK